MTRVFIYENKEKGVKNSAEAKKKKTQKNTKKPEKYKT